MRPARIKIVKIIRTLPNICQRQMHRKKWKYRIETMAYFMFILSTNLYCIDNHYWLQRGSNFSAPVLTVMDGFGRKLLDQFYKVGSSLEVMCHVDRLPKRPLPEIIEWRHGDHILSKSNTTLGQRYILVDFYRINYLFN